MGKEWDRTVGKCCSPSESLLMLPWQPLEPLPTLAALGDVRSVSHGVHTLPPGPRELLHCCWKVLEDLPSLSDAL